MLSYTFAPLIVQQLFYENQKIIADKYCINKSKPQLHCNGKCYLTKQLKALNDDETSNTSNSQKLTIKVAIEPFIIEPINSYNPSFSLNKKEFFSYQNVFLHTAFIAGIFHPPCAA
jgi:hypothetical protein